MNVRKSRIAPTEYDEDFFADTRMSFGDHIEDLRSHLLRAIYGFCVALVLGIFASYYVLDFIKAPVDAALQDYHLDNYANDLVRQNAFLKGIQKRAQGAEGTDPLRQLNQPIPMRVQVSPKELDQTMRQMYPDLFKQGGPLEKAKPPQEQAPTVTMQVQTKPLEVMDSMHGAFVLMAKRTNLTALSVMETFFVYFKVALVCGLVIGSPWIIRQIWLFIAAGLYPHERRYFTAHLPLAIVLFLGGVAICEFCIIPAALKALLSFNQWLNVEPDLRLADWLSFAIWMPVITGLCFETPLAMILLTKLGIFNSADYLSKWRHAAFVMCIIAAIVTPSVDPFSLLFVWVPMVGLYFLGIYLVKRIEARERLEEMEEQVAYQPTEEMSGSSGN
jgi:sec-independent protein translocase protein TatC